VDEVRLEEAMSCYDNDSLHWFDDVYDRSRHKLSVDGEEKEYVKIRLHPGPSEIFFRYVGTHKSVDYCYRILKICTVKIVQGKMTIIESELDSWSLEDPTVTVIRCR